MLKSTHTAAGLGYPPEIFTTNSNESLNATIKRKVTYKETKWPEFNESIKQLVMSQRDGVSFWSKPIQIRQGICPSCCCSSTMGEAMLEAMWDKARGISSVKS